MWKFIIMKTQVLTLLDLRSVCRIPTEMSRCCFVEYPAYPCNWMQGNKSSNTGTWYLIVYYISMAQCNTAVTPLLMHWSYCSFAVSHPYHMYIYIYIYIYIYQNTLSNKSSSLITIGHVTRRHVLGLQVQTDERYQSLDDWQSDYLPVVVHHIK